MNKARCKLCGDTIESVSRHDFKYCGCKAIFVDGGSDYWRYGGDMNAFVRIVGDGEWEKIEEWPNEEPLRSNRMNLEHSPQYLFCHDEGTCLGEHCTVHNRSDHNMRSFPQNWRWDRGLMERICPHGVGHPDPDEINLDVDNRSVHGCDGCCKKEKVDA